MYNNFRLGFENRNWSARCEMEGAPVYAIAEFEQLPRRHCRYLSGTAEVRANREGHSCLFQGGRLNGNLMDDVGVPKSISMNLTYPEQLA